MAKEHDLTPLWIGIACMTAGVLLIYWVFHSGSPATDDVAVPALENDGGTMCAQVITPAKNSETGEVVDFPTPCDVPEGWEVVQPAVTE